MKKLFSFLFTFILLSQLGPWALVASSATKTPVLSKPSGTLSQNPYSSNGYDNQSGAYNSSSQSSYGSSNYNGNPGSIPPLQGRVVTAPAGSSLSATPSGTLSSETARVGDRLTATLGGDLAAGGSVVLPSGSQLEAQVVSVVKATHAGRNGQLDVRFTSATLPNGQRIPISGRIQTADGSGLIKGGTVTGSFGRAAVKTGIGAGLGAALGTAMGPLSGGGVGRGAIYGTALGGGLGAAASLWQKGKDAVLNGGQPLNVVLDQPVTVSASQTMSPSGYGSGYNNNAAPADNGNYNGGYYGN